MNSEESDPSWARCATCGEDLAYGLPGLQTGSCIGHGANYCRECFDLHLIECHGAPAGFNFGRDAIGLREP